jgi:DNA primase
MLVIWDTPLIVELEVVLHFLKQEMEEMHGRDYFGRSVESGSNLMVKCPFHKDGQERKPSMGIRVDDGQFNCFTCGEHGDLPMFVAKCLDLGVKRDTTGGIVEPPKPELGYKWLLKKFNLAVQGERPGLGLGQSRTSKRFDRFVPESDLEQYYEYVHPYMEEVRFIPQKMQDYLEIGYDKATNSVIFLMKDLKGNVFFVKKRPITSYNDVRYTNVKDIPKKHLMFGAYYIYRDYVATPKKWMSDMIHKNGITLVEGEIDVASGWTLRMPTVGIGGRIFFKEQAKVLAAMGVKNINLGLDNDEEGQKETVRIVDNYSSTFRLSLIKYPDWAKDMNDVVKNGKGIEVLKFL